MQNGSLMIILTNEEISDEMEYQRCFLSQNNQNICIGSSSRILCSTKSIIEISSLNDEMLEKIRCALNIIGVTTQGLDSLMFSVELKEENPKRLYFIGDSCRSSYIWFQGLRSLCHNSNQTSIKSLPLIVSNRLRFGHQSLCDVSNKNTSKSSEFLLSIQKELPTISKIANDLYSFACRSCILDSTEHLTLLSEAMELKHMSDEVESYLKNNETKENDEYCTNIEQLWFELRSKCCVVCLKSSDLQKNMLLSRFELKK